MWVKRTKLQLNIFIIFHQVKLQKQNNDFILNDTQGEWVSDGRESEEEWVNQQHHSNAIPKANHDEPQIWFLIKYSFSLRLEFLHY